MIRRPPRSPLFPSTTLFRSLRRLCHLALKSLWISSHQRYLAHVKRRSEEHTSELQSHFHLIFPLLLFFLNDPPPTEISPLPLHDALPISSSIMPSGA